MGSAPKNMLARLHKFLPENSMESGDQIWFVLDVDRWKRESIEDLRNLCAGYQGWGIAISNPCFEVWLYFHKGDPRQIEAKNPKDFKRLLDTLHPSGYSVEDFTPLISIAAIGARQADPTPDHDYPDQWATTKVYHLADEMLKFLGNNWV